MKVPRRADGYVSRLFDQETVVVPVRAGVANLETIFTMNGVGSTIWAHIDGKASAADLARAVVAEYAVGEAEAEADVAEFVELLVSKGLVVVEGRLDVGAGG
ncbi:MAG TPA: PqqD family protein [Polyangia bacterium]|nr:PqqD family protein [Polyangia bacterium]